jgi:hypothetical protein
MGKALTWLNADSIISSGGKAEFMPLNVTNVSESCKGNITILSRPAQPRYDWFRDSCQCRFPLAAGFTESYQKAEGK